MKVYSLHTVVVNFKRHARRKTTRKKNSTKLKEKSKPITDASATTALVFMTSTTNNACTARLLKYASLSLVHFVLFSSISIGVLTCFDFP